MIFLRTLILISIASGFANAHEPLASWATARLFEDKMVLQVSLAPAMIKPFLDAQMGRAPWIDYSNFSENYELLKSQAPHLFRVQSGSEILSNRGTEVVWTDDDDIEFWLTYPRPRMNTVFFEAVYLGSMVGEHAATLVVFDEENQQLGWEVLSRDSDVFELNLQDSPRSHFSSFRIFVGLGIEHILLGYDHLMFLFGLLIVCRRLASMALLISCFTLAHSLTLSLSALDWVVLPARLVEPLIALSILYVGVENLLRDPRHRWLLTLLFGLVHGFGFANVLRQTGLAAGGWALVAPLFSFNLGVEIGQIAVAVFVLPLIIILRKRTYFIRYGLPAASWAVVAMGGYWFLLRVFFT
jgi:hypothetical protein